MEELAQGHPWALTFGDFLRRITSEFGFTLHVLDATDSAGRPASIRYLKDAAEGRIIVLPGLRDEDQLDSATTASLCRQAGIPPEFFGLASEEPSDETF